MTSHCYTQFQYVILCHIVCYKVTLHVLLHASLLHSMSYWMSPKTFWCYTVMSIVTSYCYIWLFGVLWLSSCIKWNIKMVCFMLWISWGSDSCRLRTFSENDNDMLSFYLLVLKMTSLIVVRYSGNFWQSLFYRARDVKEIYSDLQEFQTRSSDLTQWLVVQIEMLENAENDSLNAQQLNDKVNKCNI